jgi:hypothetical protein
MKLNIAGTVFAAAIWLSALAGFATVLILCLFVLWLAVMVTASAQEVRLTIAKMEGQQKGKEVAIAAYNDSNNVALMTAPKIDGQQTLFLYRVDTNSFGKKTTVYLPAEKGSEFLTLRPKFNGAIKEKR